MDKRNAALDLLRFSAAIVVAVPHLIIFYKGSEHTRNLEILTALSVEVFFALSGFVLAPIIFDIIAAPRHVAQNTKVFFVRRWMRTLPLFYFSACLHFVIFDPDINAHALSYFVFLQNFAWSAPSYDYFSVSWSLAIEEWFYLALPLFLIACRRVLRNGNPLSENDIFAYTWMFVGIFVLMKLFNPVAGEEWGGDLRRVTLFRLDTIAFGGLLYLLVKRRSVLVRPMGLLISIPVQAGLLYITYVRILSGEATYIESNFLVFVLMATFSCALVGVVYAAEAIFPASLRQPSIWGGRISYGVYLFHIPVGVLAQIMLPDNTLGVGAQIALATICLCAFSAIIYQFFERPILMHRPRYAAQ